MLYLIEGRTLEPVTFTAGLNIRIIGGVIVSLFPEATPSVMLCALAGTALYIITEQAYEIWKQMIFAFISFVGGVYCAGMSADIIAAFINSILQKLEPGILIAVSPSVGALIGSSVCVTFLLRIISRYKKEG